MAGRTVLIVAHTDGWAGAAHRVVTLDGGQVRDDQPMVAEPPAELVAVR